MQLQLLIVVALVWPCSSETQPKLTLDEFFNVTSFSWSSLSPNGQHLLVHSRRPHWSSNNFEDQLWLYETQGTRKKLITDQLFSAVEPKWSPSGKSFVFVTNENASTLWEGIIDGMQPLEKNSTQVEQYLQFYDVATDQMLAVEIGSKLPSAVAWSGDGRSLYFATPVSPPATYNDEWRDVIQYRLPQPTDQSLIQRLDIRRSKRRVSVKIGLVATVNFSIAALLLIPSKQQLILTSASMLIEQTDVVELYALNLRDSSTLTRLTNNTELELNVQLSVDGQHLFYQTFPVSSEDKLLVQGRLYSMNVQTGHTERWAKDFVGNVRDFTIRPEGGVYFLGQLGTNVQVYMQQSTSKYSVLLDGCNGTYRGISSSSERPSSIAFAYSAFQQPEEIYFVQSIGHLRSARAVTNENTLLTQRSLPQGEVYRWVNTDDDRTIEGILHYPPGQFRSKNLPLLVLIHGGPTDASLNMLIPDWYYWAPMAASEGWLVFEPNYRGSTGYGDAFASEIVGQPSYRPGRDILAGVDRLIAEGIADPKRLTIGGFSYGGVMTNWLITQTTRFNAALSGAGIIDLVSTWGVMDLPVYVKSINGGYPWEVPEVYANQSAIYHLGNVRTPTHIVTGAKDIRVPADQSYILERGLHYLGVPTRLLLFPNVGHTLSTNPWHGKIKVREELKWLAKYGHSLWNASAH